MRVASFDIGKRNFAVLVIDYLDTGTEIVYWNVHDLTHGSTNLQNWDVCVLGNLTHFMDTHQEMWNATSVFLIEKQMAFGNQHNTVALRIGQHLQSYLLVVYGPLRAIVEFPSVHKTRVLGASATLTKPERKRWCVDQVPHILETVADTRKWKTHFDAFAKRDDLADVLCQAMAFMELAGR